MFRTTVLYVLYKLGKVNTLLLGVTKVNSPVVIRQCYLVPSKADCTFIYNMHHTLCIWGKTGQTSVHPGAGIVH